MGGKNYDEYGTCFGFVVFLSDAINWTGLDWTGQEMILVSSDVNREWTGHWGGGHWGLAVIDS